MQYRDPTARVSAYCETFLQASVVDENWDNFERPHPATLMNMYRYGPARRVYEQ